MPLPFPAPAAFNYFPAMQWINGWVATVDDPEFAWAWDAVIGSIEAHAVVPLGPKATEDADPSRALQARRNYYWLDWFSAWRDDAAHRGIFGAMEQLVHACPDEWMEELTVVLEHAFAMACGPNSTIPPLYLSGPVPSPPVPPGPLSFAKPTLRLLTGGRV